MKTNIRTLMELAGVPMDSPKVKQLIESYDFDAEPNEILKRDVSGVVSPNIVVQDVYFWAEEPDSEFRDEFGDEDEWPTSSNDGSTGISYLKFDDEEHWQRFLRRESQNNEVTFNDNTYTISVDTGSWNEYTRIK